MTYVLLALIAGLYSFGFGVLATAILDDRSKLVVRAGAVFVLLVLSAVSLSIVAGLVSSL